MLLVAEEEEGASQGLEAMTSSTLSTFLEHKEMGVLQSRKHTVGLLPDPGTSSPVMAIRWHAPSAPSLEVAPVQVGCQGRAGGLVTDPDVTLYAELHLAVQVQHLWRA